MIILAAQAAFALTPAPQAADPRPIDQLVPAGTPTTAFANVKRAFDAYGATITASSRYKQLLPLIAQGLPDPAKDIDEVGVVTDFSDRTNPDFGAIVTGRIDKDKALACAAAHNVSFGTSVYHGIIILSTKIQDRNIQVAFVDERVTALSVDRKGAHPIMQKLLDGVLAHTDAQPSILTPGYLFTGKQALEPFTHDMSDHGAWGIVKHIVNVSVDAQPRESLDVAGKIIILADSDEIAKVLGQQLQQAAAGVHQHIADPVVTVEKTTVTFTATVLKKTIEGYFGN